MPEIAGHRIESTDFYCMQCGKKRVIRIPDICEDNAGVQHYCIACGYAVMHDGNYDDMEESLKQELRLFKENGL